MGFTSLWCTQGLGNLNRVYIVLVDTAAEQNTKQGESHSLLTSFAVLVHTAHWGCKWGLHRLGGHRFWGPKWGLNRLHMYGGSVFFGRRVRAVLQSTAATRMAMERVICI
jgi:hypothetical protein